MRFILTPSVDGFAEPCGAAYEKRQAVDSGHLDGLAAGDRLVRLGALRAPQRALDVHLAGRLEWNADGADRSQELRVADRG
jgi:hypothetical protein